jgi:hypothetical protein
MKITISLTQDDFKTYNKYNDLITDYPLYGHTSGLTKGDIIALGKLLEIELPNTFSNEEIQL